MDINELIEYLLTPIAQVAIIMAIAEVVKRVGMPKRYIPVIDVLLGLIAGLVVYHFHLGFTLIEGIVVGTALGLSACGLFSGVKNVLDK